MNAIFTQQVRVRAYECDSLGHVNNAIYLQYLQEATLDAHVSPDPAEIPPMPNTLSAEYQTPARYGDELAVSTWVVRRDDTRLERGYEIARTSDGASVLRAQIGWDASRFSASAPGERPAPLKPFSIPRDNGARPWHWRHTVRRYELDLQGRAQLAAFFHWLEEATFRTAHIAGWTMDRLGAENFVTLQYRHDAEFFEPAHNGDEIEITSRLFDVRRVRGTWLHEIHRVRERALLFRDYSTGAFLDRHGNLRTPPPGMMDQLMQGEP